MARVLGIRLAIILVTISVMMTVSAHTALFMVVFFGQAHFILAYWYKFSRIPQLLGSHFFLLWVFAVVVLLGLGILNVFSFHFWLAAAALLFVYHHAYDDLKLFAGVAQPIAAFGYFLPIHLIFLIELAEEAFRVVPAPTQLWLLAGVGLVTPLYLLYRMRPDTSLVVYVISMTLLATGCMLLTPYLYISHVFGFIVLTHYALWYGEYYHKLEGLPLVQQQFVRRSLLINAAMVLIWVTAILGYPMPGLDYFFSQTFFYIWTVLHIVFSFIPAAIRLW